MLIELVGQQKEARRGHPPDEWLRKPLEGLNRIPCLLG